MTDELNALKLIFDYSFWVALNANDFFNYACADCVKLDSEDLEWIVPIVEKYGKDGIHAVMSYIREAQPLKPYVTDKFKQALKELELLNPTIYSEREQ
jgi:NADH:ubiquinone oxidoreductase subunit E